MIVVELLLTCLRSSNVFVRLSRPFLSVIPLIGPGVDLLSLFGSAKKPDLFLLAAVVFQVYRHYSVSSPSSQVRWTRFPPQATEC